MNTEKPTAVLQTIHAAAAERRDAGLSPDIPVIHIGMATCGIASGALETKKAFEEALEQQGVAAVVHPVGCFGHCYAEPVVVIDHPASGFPPILYPNVSPGKAIMLTKLYLGEGDPRFEHILGATVENEMIPWVNEFSRFSMETRIVTRLSGQIDPERIDEYILAGGYASLARALEMSKTGRLFIHPFDDSDIIAGQGTIGLELRRQLETLDTVIVPVGGGGLVSGIGGYLKSVDPAIEVVGCQPENSRVMAESVKAGRIVELDSEPTLADGGRDVQPEHRHHARSDRDPARIATHHLHDHHPVVRFGRRMQAVNALCCKTDRRIVAERDHGFFEVIVDRLRHSDDP